MQERIEKYIACSSSDALVMVICAACTREVFKGEAVSTKMDEIPHQEILAPTKPHPAHVLFQGMLLYPAGYNRNEKGWVCQKCWDSLSAQRKPALSLANGMRVGEVPFELAILTLPDRILIAKYFPAAYIAEL